jgi:hypothetical protein
VAESTAYYAFAYYAFAAVCASIALVTSRYSISNATSAAIIDACSIAASVFGSTDEAADSPPAVTILVAIVSG